MYLGGGEGSQLSGLVCLSRRLPLALLPASPDEAPDEASEERQYRYSKYFVY